MSALTTRLCVEHRHIPGTHLPDRCSCGWEPGDGTAVTWQQHFAQAVEAEIAALLPHALANAVRGGALGLQYGFSLEEVAAQWEDSDGLDTLNRIAKGEYT